MERREALVELRKLIGVDLKTKAATYSVNIANKGWRGILLEKYLSLKGGNKQGPDEAAWELKSSPLRRKKDGSFSVKETMSITMVKGSDFRKSFENSICLNKLKRMVVVVIVDESDTVKDIVPFDAGVYWYEDIKEDYITLRNTYKSNGMSGIHARIGKYLQIRTKGPGHNKKKTKAFYLKTNILTKIYQDAGVDMKGLNTKLLEKKK